MSGLTKRAGREYAKRSQAVHDTILSREYQEYQAEYVETVG